MGFDDTKKFIWTSCNQPEYRGAQGVRALGLAVEAQCGGGQDLLGDLASEFAAAYRGWLAAQRFVYEGAAAVMASDEEVIMACTLAAGWPRLMRISSKSENNLNAMDTLVAYAVMYPMPFKDKALYVTQFNPDVLRWVNSLPFSPDEKKVVLCAEGVLDLYDSIAITAENVRMAVGQETNEQKLQELIDAHPNEEFKSPSGIPQRIPTIA